MYQEEIEFFNNCIQENQKVAHTIKTSGFKMEMTEDFIKEVTRDCKIILRRIHLLDSKINDEELDKLISYVKKYKISKLTKLLESISNSDESNDYEDE